MQFYVLSLSLFNLTSIASTVHLQFNDWLSARMLTLPFIFEPENDPLCLVTIASLSSMFSRKMLKKGYETVATEEDDDEDQSSHPMIVTSDSFFSLLTLSWMNSIFKLGSQRPLNQSDFLPLHEDDRTRELTEGLQTEWNDHLQECDKTAGKRPKLWKCVVKTISVKEILYQTSFWFAESVCRVSQPLVLGFLLRLLSSPEIDRSLLYASCLLLSFSGISTACTHYSAYRFELLGMRLSSALKGIIYLKVSACTIRLVHINRIIHKQGPQPIQ